MGRIKEIDTALQELIAEHGALAVMTAVSQLSTCTCKRCGNSWRPRGDHTPQQCPTCKSRYWQVER